MTTVRRILCAIDFSAPSYEAFHFADALAQDLSAELVLVHAFDTPATLDLAGQSIPADPELRPRLADVRSSSSDLIIERVLHAGDAGEVICWLAQDRHCDLIVMGTHGHSGLAHLLFGSVAEYVLRHARCPVVTIRKIPAGQPPQKEPTVLPLPPPRFM